MPIKVISEGPVRAKRVVCPNCAYELEFTGEDVHTSFDCDGDRYQTIVCPRSECATRRFGPQYPTIINVKWP